MSGLRSSRRLLRIRFDTRSWTGVVPLLGLLFATFVALIWYSNHQDETEKKATLERNLVAVVSEVENRLYSSRKYISFFIEQIERNQLDKDGVHKLSQSLFNDYSEVNQLVLLDAEVKPVWSVRRKGKVSNGVSKDTLEFIHGYIQQNRRRQNIFYTVPFQESDGNPAVAMVQIKYSPLRGTQYYVAIYAMGKLLENSVSERYSDMYEVAIKSDNFTQKVLTIEDQELDPSLTETMAVAAPGANFILSLQRYQEPWNPAVYSLAALFTAIIGGLTLMSWRLGQDMNRRRAIEKELQRAKEAADMASRAKSELLANVSHELRTPISAIQGFANILLDKGLSYGDRHNTVQAILRNSKNLLELINDILDLSKIEAGLLDIDKMTFTLGSEIAGVVSTCRGEAVRKGLYLDVKYHFPIPECIHSDPKRLRQILLNLLSNAIKFTETGGITLEVALADDSIAQHGKLLIRVRDTGIGIAHENQSGLFQSFNQADREISRKYGGTGLGLTLSRRLARALGGDLQLVASQPGQGSTFAVTIDPGPIQDSRILTSNSQLEQGGLQPIEMRDNTDLHGVHVLIVEDSPDNRTVYRRILAFAGAEVTLASHGREGVESALMQNYDVILMDIQMPEMDGYEATSSLRAAGYQGAILALTANALKGERERCLQAGCDDYLMKPVEPDALIKLVSLYARTDQRQGAKAALPQHSAMVGPTSEMIPEYGRGSAPIRSLYINDPRVAPVIPEYVRALPGRVGELRLAWQDQNSDRLRKLAHQIKGTSASYGFPQIAAEAEQLEEALMGDGFDSNKVKECLDKISNWVGLIEPVGNTSSLS